MFRDGKSGDKRNDKIRNGGKKQGTKERKKEEGKRRAEKKIRMQKQRKPLTAQEKRRERWNRGKAGVDERRDR